MATKKMLSILGTLVALAALVAFTDSKNANAPEYTSDGALKFPQDYRYWTYITSGLDMSYNAAAQSAMAAGHHMFDNVFVNPSSYKAFLESGTWPDKTQFVLEVREAKGKGSINQHGNFQDTDVMGYDVHVKDSRFPGGWAFFNFDDTAKPAKMIDTKAECYSCHSQHGAVDTTFVQFYPTLMPVAKEKGTLSANYVKEEAARAAEPAPAPSPEQKY